MPFTPCQKREVFAITKFEVIKERIKKDSQKEEGITDLIKTWPDFGFFRPLRISNTPMCISGVNSLKIPCTSAG